MKNRTSTKTNIHQFIKQAGKARVEDIRREFNLSRAIIHRHLNQLVKQQLVKKTGKPPVVFYLPSSPTPTQTQQKIDKKSQDTINQTYLYVSPSGEMAYGLNGFRQWANQTKQINNLSQLVKDYTKTRLLANIHYNRDNLINASYKLKNTFNQINLEKIFYADFYALPNFGKTILGQKVLYAKQAQLPKLIKEIAFEITPNIQKIIVKHKIQAIGFIPPTIPRKLQFLKELEHNLNIPLPKINLTKAYPSDIPVAQKTLPKLHQRIENARNTIFVKDKDVNFSNILLIDDAVGSGSTLNETAAKLKQQSGKKIYGFAVVGSYKGFDVISEV
jgi:phosphoribosylpyrophosphate synthetase